MARMLPSRIAPEVTSSAERRVYEWFENDPATDDWIAFHSLGLSRHEKLLYGEVDFVVLAPCYGVFCLEVKDGGIARWMDSGNLPIGMARRTEKPEGPLTKRETACSRL
ncbi:Nuclease-related domain protein [Coriobacteriaceae bacterium CHKCI002]|nr:Nuclease-related domain protein [Coriobacteriaceae bacterium CHKCI002]